MKVIFEDLKIKVEENGNGEIFVSRTKDKNIKIRITPLHGLTITSASGLLVAGPSINGCATIIVMPRKN